MRHVCAGVLGLVIGAGGAVHAQGAESVLAQVQAERQPLIDTLRELVSIESGSRDPEGLTRIAAVIAARLRELGGEVELVDPADIYPMHDTPERIGRSVVARFHGTGSRRILLLAHMDTVYLPGMLADQPFKIEGDYAYGLGIADDKHGVAIILHAIATLQALGFDQYGLISVLINADEEVSSPGSRSLITRLGREHDVVFSCEGGGVDRVRLTTAGIGAFTLTARGRASHAGSALDQSGNALYELAHQILQTRDLSNFATGLTMNWTVATAGDTRNVIPAHAQATADVRVLALAGFDRIERLVKERIARQLIPDVHVDLVFERRRPPLKATGASRQLARHAQRVYRELGRELTIDERASGGGTDAAFAALETRAAVIEGMGLHGMGAHSNDAEYIDLRSIEPRLYLLTRVMMDVATNEAGITR